MNRTNYSFVLPIVAGDGGTKDMFNTRTAGNEEQKAQQPGMEILLVRSKKNIDINNVKYSQVEQGKPSNME